MWKPEFYVETWYTVIPCGNKVRSALWCGKYTTCGNIVNPEAYSMWKP